MPSRTYIQMYLRFYNAGKLPLCKEVLNKLIKYNAVLEKHPEAVEEIVQRRVDMIKYAKTMCPQIKLQYWNYIIFEQCIIDSMFLAELIEPAKFDDFDFSPNLYRIAMDFQPVMPNAIVTIV
jgi:hypothetical protein